MRGETNTVRGVAGQQPVTRWAIAVIGAVAAGMPSSLARAQTPAPYAFPGLETIQEQHVLLDAVPIRPMAASSTKVYAVNVQGNCVLEFGAPTDPVRRFDVPWNPVSVAYYTTPAPSSQPKLLVVCRGSYVMVRIDVTTGAIDGLVRLSPQPADIIVDEAASPQRAFVSCQAKDEVLQIDLSTMLPAHTFKIPGKTPTSLFFDSSNNVIVAPLHSGNNSGVHKSTNFKELRAQKYGILDFDLCTPSPSPGTPGGLPDEDLFMCTPGGGVTAVAKKLGTLLYNAARNPVTGDWWILNSEALNKNPLKQTEASIRGEFSLNRLSILTAPNTTPTIVYLDDTNTATATIDYFVPNPPPPTPPPATWRSIGHPDGLTFEPTYGWAFLVGTQTDNIAMLDATGQVIATWDLAAGSIPRQALWVDSVGLLFVYCWGRNVVEAWNGGVVHTNYLGLDPTSEERKRGRKLFYNGRNSLHGNLSCETCHAYGEMDFLAWNLSHGQEDAKGPLVTQTLRGIDGTMPFHWRGEQQNGIEDFNPAFETLLGGNKLTPAGYSNPLEDLTEYLLALRGDANPYQNPDRKVDSSIATPLKPTYTGDAVAGALAFQDNPSFPSSSNQRGCMTCHALPTGSNNENQALRDTQTPFTSSPVNVLNPRVHGFEVGTFNGIWKKHQDYNPSTTAIDPITVTFNTSNPTYSGLPATEEYPLLGYGFGHAGTIDSLNEFLEIFDQAAPGGQTPQMNRDIAAFIHQFDQRMAPMSHEAYLLDSNNATSTDILNLISRVSSGQGDLAVFGISPIAGSPRHIRWVYDPSLSTFVSEETGITQTFSTFQSQVALGGSNVFVGLPRGTGLGFAIDYDMDDLLNADELGLKLDPYDRDWDHDSWWDGHEVHNLGNPKNAAIVSSDITRPTILSAEILSVTTRNAVLTVTADEPVTLEITYGPLGSPSPRLLTINTLAKTHRVVLDDLRASLTATATALPAPLATFDSDYSISIDAIDRGGNRARTVPPPPPSIYPTRSGDFTAGALGVYDPIEVVLTELHTTSIPSLSSATLTASVEYRVDYKAGAPGVAASDYLVIFRVLNNGAPVTATVIPSATPPVAPPVTFQYIDFGVPGMVFYPTPPSPPTPPLAPVSVPGALSGDFLIPDKLTDSNGRHTVVFDVPNVLTTDEITLNVEFVGLSPNPNTPPAPWTPSAPVQMLTLSQWDMPGTLAPYRKLKLYP